MTRGGPAFGYVYVIGSRAGRPVKIGRSGNPSKRLMAFQDHHPDELCLFHATEGPCGLAHIWEGLMHKALAEHRLRGEWFDVTADVAGSLLQHMQDCYNDQCEAPAILKRMRCHLTGTLYWSKTNNRETVSTDRKSEYYRGISVLT